MTSQSATRLGMQQNEQVKESFIGVTLRESIWNQGTDINRSSKKVKVAKKATP